MPSSTIPALDRPLNAPTILRTVADDPAAWAEEHRDALRPPVTDHGALLVRGLGLRNRAQTGAVFRGLASERMTEREALAPRVRRREGTYSPTAWPSRQPMCTHHELSHALKVPGLMLFASLTVPTIGGAEPWQAGDLLLVENIRTAHSYEPYTGAREVVLAMADPVRLAEGDPGDGSPR
jgi:hypothetical protein